MSLHTVHMLRAWDRCAIILHNKYIVSTAYAKLPSWSSLCLLKIHMEYVGRERERERRRDTDIVLCGEEKMVCDLF